MLHAAVLAVVGVMRIAAPVPPPEEPVVEMVFEPPPAVPLTEPVSETPPPLVEERPPPEEIVPPPAPPDVATPKPPPEPEPEPEQAAPPPPPPPVPPARQEPPKPRPKPIVRSPVARSIPTPQAPQPPLAVARPTIPPVASQPAAPPVDGAWQGSVASWLVSHKSYPEEARRRGEEGRVIVRFTVDRSGHVIDATIVGSSGSERLDAATITLLRTAVLPAFPPSMTLARITITTSMRYSLR